MLQGIEETKHTSELRNRGGGDMLLQTKTFSRAELFGVCQHKLKCLKIIYLMKQKGILFCSTSELTASALFCNTDCFIQAYTWKNNLFMQFVGSQAWLPWPSDSLAACRGSRISLETLETSTKEINFMGRNRGGLLLSKIADISQAPNNSGSEEHIWENAVERI